MWKYDQTVETFVEGKLRDDAAEELRSRDGKTESWKKQAEGDGRTVHRGQAVCQLADFDVQSVVSHSQLVDCLVHTG